MREEIDVVIAWVDGNDPAWQAEKAQWAPPHDRADRTIDASAARYRDWDTLRYLLRGVERFAPWVRTVHLMTWGHLPPWLDPQAPGLHVARHEEFIPSRYRPTFSSHPIEWNMHRIEGLAERFVYFNDDMFLLQPVPAERFFRHGLPRDIARLGVIADSTVDHIVLNNVEAINRRYRKGTVLRRHPAKWLSWRYPPAELLKTLTLLPWSFFTGFRDTHMPQPFLRSTFERLWAEEHALLDATCCRRFRSLEDVSPWLARYEQLVRGEFEPVATRDIRLDTLSDYRIDAIARYVAQGRYTMVCLNDDNALDDFEEARKRLQAAFETLLPRKSRYER